MVRLFRHAPFYRVTKLTRAVATGEHCRAARLARRRPCKKQLAPTPLSLYSAAAEKR